MSASTTRIARTYLAIREQQKAITKQLEEIEASLKELLQSTDGQAIIIDGHTISLVEAERRSFDALALKELVSASVFRKVTEPTVKTKLLDSAVALGTIGDDVLDQITSVTPYTQVRVK